MRAELEEPGMVVGKAAIPLVTTMEAIEECGWFGVYGSPDKPRAILVAAIGDEAEALVKWLRSRTAFDSPLLKVDLGEI